MYYSGSNVSYDQQVVLILEHSFWLKKQGYRDTTIDTSVHSLKALAKVCDLMDPEKVKEAIAFRNVSEGQKEKLCSTYDRFCKHNKLEWSIPRFRRVIRLPHVPKSDDILLLINALSKRQSTFLQCIFETGGRPGEIWQLKWIDIDSENNQVVINNPEKNSNPRRLRVSKGLIAKLLALRKKNEYVFQVQEGSSFLSFARCFYKSRARISEELGNSNINRINLKSLRHFRASQLYHDTKDLLHVKQTLGHRSISSTMIYVHLTEFEEDAKYVVKIASTIEEFTELLSLGFEYITDYNNMKVLRKRM